MASGTKYTEIIKYLNIAITEEQLRACIKTVFPTVLIDETHAPMPYSRNSLVLRLSSLLSISGAIGSGKSTLGLILEQDHGYTQISYAGPLKNITSYLFNLDREMLEGATREAREARELGDPSPRTILQLMGTEVFRQFDENIWITNVFACAPTLTDKIVITDARFPNELEHVRSLGGHSIYITRLLSIPSSSTHASELSLRLLNCDYNISNHGTITDLKMHIKVILDVIYYK